MCVRACVCVLANQDRFERNLTLVNNFYVAPIANYAPSLSVVNGCPISLLSIQPGT